MATTNLQEELTQASKTAVVWSIAILCEPVILILVAIMLNNAELLRTLPEGDSLVGIMRTLFVLLSIAAFAGFFAVWRLMFTPDKIAPTGAAASKIRSNYVSTQISLNVIAVIPSTLGFVLFVLSGKMTFLIVVAVLGIVLLAVIFPRPENLATMVAEQASKSKESGIGTIEEWEQYKNEQEAQKKT